VSKKPPEPVQSHELVLAPQQEREPVHEVESHCKYTLN
jgi:hypothetical protein